MHSIFIAAVIVGAALVAAAIGLLGVAAARVAGFPALPPRLSVPIGRSG
jgi:hypothetical protein